MDYLNSGEGQPLQQADQCSIQCQPGETIGEMVARDYRKAAVFSKYGIDFCCGGKKNLRQVCYEKKLDYATVAAELENVGQQQSVAVHPYHEWPLQFLSGYIVNVHHRYTKDALTELKAYANKVDDRHGDKNPELAAIKNYVAAIALELEEHMLKEENVLFPMIGQLCETAAQDSPSDRTAPDIRFPIRRMVEEHEQAGHLLQQIRNLTNGFIPPSHACATWKVFYHTLAAFESDLHLHIHLENNILFPATLKLAGMY